MKISLLYSLDAAGITVCLFSAFMLFMRSDGIRARKVLGGTLLAWGIIYLITFLRISEIDRMSERGFMPLFGLIGGTIGCASMLFYVVEVMRSGWLSWKKILLILSPYFLSILLFTIVSLSGAAPIRHLEDATDFIRHFREFNVWYRLVFMFITLFYVGFMIMAFVRYAPEHRKWSEENYSFPELMDISWLRYFLAGIIIITAIYFYAMGSETLMPLYVHFSFIIVFFTYLAYKALFLRNPYPEDFFKKESTVFLQSKKKAAEPTSNEKYTEAEGIGPSPKMEEYLRHFEAWMECDKPYLRSDFKLADVQARFPMNRTYLARFFNEFYGCSFSHLVRRYRAEEAMRLIRRNPGLVSKELFPLCGFTSETAFHRAFSEATGMTPKQFRMTIND